MKSLSLILGGLALVLHFGACATSSDISGNDLEAPTDAAAAAQGAGGSVAETATEIAKDVAVDTAKRAATNAATNAISDQVGGGAVNAVNTGRSAVNTANALR